jgi:hypothetical protein
MFKLAAAIHNCFVVVRYIGAEAHSSRGPRQVFAPTVQGPQISWHFSSVVVLKPSTDFAYAPVYGRDVAMSASLCESHLPASTLPLSPNCSWASLAGKAPAACSQLQRMGR